MPRTGFGLKRTDQATDSGEMSSFLRSRLLTAASFVISAGTHVPYEVRGVHYDAIILDTVHTVHMDSTFSWNMYTGRLGDWVAVHEPMQLSKSVHVHVCRELGALNVDWAVEQASQTKYTFWLPRMASGPVV